MKSTIIFNDIENFYIRLYFDTKDGYLSASINRAYRDFNRTIKNMPNKEAEKINWRNDLRNILDSRINTLLAITFSNQEEFTNWHKETCFALHNKSNNILTIGQAQKWVNMSLKYAFTLGENRINGINRNYQFFHIPIDNIIQEILKEKYGIEKINSSPWSKIDDYEIYYDYQKEVRRVLTGKIALDEEFKLFNKS